MSRVQGTPVKASSLLGKLLQKRPEVVNLKQYKKKKGREFRLLYGRKIERTATSGTGLKAACSKLPDLMAGRKWYYLLAHWGNDRDADNSE